MGCLGKPSVWCCGECDDGRKITSTASKCDDDRVANSRDVVSLSNADKRKSTLRRAAHSYHSAEQGHLSFSQDSFIKELGEVGTHAQGTDGGRVRFARPEF